MSEPIPEAIPVSAERRSNSDRPAKRRALLSPKSKQAAELDALFAKPDREIRIPTGSSQKELAPPPEIVTNVQGSSAGAGSGEFHVYKASRRREAERLRLMDEEAKKEKEDKEFEEHKEKVRQLDEKKTSKNRKRREKQRANKAKAKHAAKSGANGTTNSHANGVDDKKDDGDTSMNGTSSTTNVPTKRPVEKDEDIEDFDEDGVVIHDD
jgi:Protein of unknown function (DUF1168)